MHNKSHNLLLIDGSRQGFSLIVGCLMQKRPIDAIVLHGNMVKPGPLADFNQWLKSKFAPPVIYNQSIESVIKSLTDFSLKKVESVTDTIKSKKNCYVSIQQNDYSVDDLINSWSWTEEVTSAVIRMSSLPQKTQRLILNL